jgi:hypothetical protein
VTLRTGQAVHGPDQLFQGERLGDGAVRDRGSPLPDVHASRQEGDGDLRVTAAHPARDLDSVLGSQVHVEEDEHDVLPADELLDLGLAARLHHAKPLELEIDAAEEAHGLVVVGHDDNTTVWARHRWMSVTAYDAGRMERTVRRGEPQTYAQAVGDLWERVGSALVRLERIAESPPELVAEDFVDELPSLQYDLHAGAELAVGIEPPRGAEELHEELVASLGEARDATAEVALALEAADVELVEPLLPEWRGILFRVRLARLRVLERTARSRETPAEPVRARKRERAPVAAIAATVLVVGGAFLFTAGAVLAAWPVWAAGLGLFAGGFLLLRP